MLRSGFSFGPNIGVYSLMQEVLVECLVCSRSCAGLWARAGERATVSRLCVWPTLEFTRHGVSWRNCKAQEDCSSKVLEPSEDQKTCE